MNFDDLSKLIKKRASHRKFLRDPVPEEVIKQIVENASYAPNGHNMQPWRFIAVTRKELIEKMADAVEKGLTKHYPSLSVEMVEQLEKYQFFLTHFKDAPLVIAVFTRKDSYITSKLANDPALDFKWPEHFDMELLGIGAAVQNLILSAEALGFASCWMTEPVVYAQKEVEELLNVEGAYHFVSLIALGKQVKERAPMPRKAVEEILKIKN